MLFATPFSFFMANQRHPERSEGSVGDLEICDFNRKFEPET
jgi:hypothetical protein